MEIIFNRVHSKKDLAISSTILAAGIGLYFANAALGILVALCGMFMLLFYKTACKREGDDTLLEKKALELSVSRRESLINYLNGTCTTLNLNGNSEGAIIRLEVYFNSNYSVAYAQLYDFINYSYIPAGEIVELHGSKADILIDNIKKAK